MSRNPFNERELGQLTTGLDPAVSELESYVALTEADPPDRLGDRVMRAIEHDATPRNGVLAWLLPGNTTGGGFGRLARVGVFGATVVLAVAGSLFAGRLADLVRHVGTGSPTPTESVLPTASPSRSPSLSPSPSSTPSPSVESIASPTSAASEGGGGSTHASRTPDVSESETAEPSAGKVDGGAEETSSR